MNASPPRSKSFWSRLYEWALPAGAPQEVPSGESANSVDWFKAIPYALIHAACLGVIWVGWSWPAVFMAVFFYALRVFVLTGFYHRYFAHRAFKVGRITQFVFGWIGCTAIQKSPLWWAAHHRHHHTHSDDEHDLHSPRQSGFWYAHMGWFLTPKCGPTNYRLIPDFAKYPEMRWLDRYELVPPILLIGLLYLTGFIFSYQWPELGCTGLQMVIWFFISTVAVYQVTYLVNTATHMFGTRRYRTKDDSRNSLIIALLTFGEGWHNNHHYYPNSARQGFFWWEIDITYYVLRFMQMFGLVWEVRPVPTRLLHPKPKSTADLPTIASPVTPS